MSAKVENKILGVLSRTSSPTLDSLERVELTSGMVLQEPGSEIEHVYFPEDGMVTLLSVGLEGGSIQIGVIGSDGMVGIPVVLGGFSPHKAVVQIDGFAWKMGRRRIAEQFRENRQLHDVLLKYTNSLLVQIAQSSICNCFHTIQERLSRWLLLAQDASQSDRLPVTHDLVSRLLGTRRASITVTAGLLQKAGFLRMARGEIVIANRQGLEGIACECYGIIREGMRRSISTHG